MGQEGSIQAPQYTVKDGFEKDQFQKQHNANHPELVVQQLSSIGTDLSKISPKVPIPMAVPHPKILFIICNTYTTEQYKLGSGPLNDSVNVASFLKQLGYTIYFLHNSTSKIFIEWFRHILKNATTDLVLFFAGYATTPKEEEANGKNDVIFFDDGYVKDEELSDLLSQCRGPTQRTVLLSDCCHSGTIWDLQSFKKEAPKNVLSISCAKDSDGTVDSKDQGIFTLYFWKIYSQNQSISVKQMKEEIATPLSKYQLHLDYYLTTPELENQPIFAKPEEAPAKPAPKLSLKPAAKTETQNKNSEPAKTETKPAQKPVVSERAAPAPAPAKEEPKPAEVATPKEEPKPAAAEQAKEEPKPAEVATPKEEPAPTPQPETKEEAAPAKKEESDEDKKSSSDDEDKKDKKSSSDDEDKKDKKSSSDDEDDKSSSDNEDKKDKKSSSDDEDDKSSSDDEDKKAKKSSSEDDKSSDDEDDKSD